MRKTPLLLALSLAVVATPTALAAHPSASDAAHPPKSERAQGPKGTHHLLKACVIVDDATETGVELEVLSANRHMRDVLHGDTVFSAKLDATTLIRLVGKARFQPEGSTPKKLSKVGSWTNLEMGDVVTVRYRVERGLNEASMPAAWRVIDHGPFPKKCPVLTTPPTGEQPPGDETPGL